MIIFNFFRRHSGKSSTFPYRNHDENRSQWQWITFTPPSLHCKSCANLDWFNFTRLIPSGRVPEALHVAAKKKWANFQQSSFRFPPQHHLDLRGQPVRAPTMEPVNHQDVIDCYLLSCVRVCVIDTKAPIVRCGSIMGTRAREKSKLT